MPAKSGPIRPTSVEDLGPLVGTELGTSEWHEITQELINNFAEMRGDHQWIHIDPERGAKSEFGAAIGHDLCVLPLGPASWQNLWPFDGFAHSLNYGYEKVRFPAPLPGGSRIRMRAIVASVDDLGGSANIVITQQFELEGGTKPVCVAQQVVRFIGHPGSGD